MRVDQADRHFSLVHAAQAEAGGNGLRHKLKALAERLSKINVFTKGQVVKWKPGLKNRRFPDYGEPVIVTDVLSVPTFDPSENSAGSPYYQEPLTIVVGMCRDDEFIEFRLDGGSSHLSRDQESGGDDGGSKTQRPPPGNFLGGVRAIRRGETHLDGLRA